MNSYISYCLMVVCAVILLAHQSQAKKGCSSYGHACYGGHGKRSLGSYYEGSSAHAGAGMGVGGEATDVHPDAALQVLLNEANANAAESDFDLYNRFRAMKIMRALFGTALRRPTEQLSEFNNAPASAESYNRWDNNAK